MIFTHDSTAILSVTDSIEICEVHVEVEREKRKEKKQINIIYIIYIKWTSSVTLIFCAVVRVGSWPGSKVRVYVESQRVRVRGSEGRSLALD